MKRKSWLELIDALPNAGTTKEVAHLLFLEPKVATRLLSLFGKGVLEGEAINAVRLKYAVKAEIFEDPSAQNYLASIQNRLLGDFLDSADWDALAAVVYNDLRHNSNIKLKYTLTLEAKRPLKSLAGKLIYALVRRIGPKSLKPTISPASYLTPSTLDVQPRWERH